MKRNIHILLIFLVFPLCVQAQYFPESLDKWEAIITQDVQWPKASQVEAFKKAPLIVIKATMPKYNAKRAKRWGDYYEEEFKREKQFVKNYNAAIDSIIIKYYPYKDKARKMTEESYGKMKKGKKDRVYAYIRPKDNTYLHFGLSNERKALYALPILEDMEYEAVNMAAEFQFIFHRLENYFKRMEKGSRTSMKIYKACKAELNEKLAKEFGEKTLLIDRNFLAEDVGEEQVRKSLDLPFRLVRTEEINKVILNKPTDVWYLKVVPYTGFDRRSTPGIDGDRSNDFGSIEMKRVNRRFRSGAHYIVDPTDGTAVYVRFNLDAEITENALNHYNSQLKESQVSLR